MIKYGKINTINMKNPIMIDFIEPNHKKNMKNQIKIIVTDILQTSKMMRDIKNLSKKVINSFKDTDKVVEKVQKKKNILLIKIEVNSGWTSTLIHK
jgi:3-deoxy-D-arabino-heptulosonate 7-phosphate (DAHP) synthase